jgi:deoxyribose-phosphate aldolase
MSNDITLKSLAKMIDHSLLHPTFTDKIIIEGCELSKRYDVATACVKPYSTAMAAEILKGSDVAVCSVVTFPHGNSSLVIKLKEIEQALHDGAAEIDTVVNIGKVLGGDWDYVSNEIKEMNKITVDGDAILKVIFENDYLEDNHIIKLCEICSTYEVAFVKTSTGYGFVKQPDGSYNYKGAIDRHLKLMREKSSANVQIKAAGGVRTLDDLLRVRDIGVTRIGATATQTILEDAKKRGFA